MMQSEEESESEHFIAAQRSHRYVQMQSESALSSSQSFRQASAEPAWIFEELPKATIVSVSRPDVSDITPMLLSYTIEFRYKQVFLPCISFLFDILVGFSESDIRFCFIGFRRVIVEDCFTLSLPPSINRFHVQA